MSKGWIGVDLDGTLAIYDGWKGIDHIGKPIPPMMARIHSWLAQGHTVKIFTARVSRDQGDDIEPARRAIQDWLVSSGLPVLEVVCCKDFGMIELWDDRCVPVIRNTGIIGMDKRGL